MKFDKLSNSLNIKQIKRMKNSILYMKEYGENLHKKPIDLSLKNKQMAFWARLLFELLCFSSYADIEVMNIFFF